jgi:outer membrane lipoprotein-sorting protein
MLSGRRVVMNKTLISIGGAVLCLSSALAGDLSVEEIIGKADAVSYYSGKDGRADVKMTIEDGKGGTRVREFTILRLDIDEKDQKFYVYFKSPPDVRKMAYLVWKKPGKDDDRWLWLPALNLNKRIAPGDKRTSFVGSDFLYEDVSGRGVEEDAHQLLSSEGDMYHIKSVPKSADSVEFSYYEVWIDKQNYLPRKAEYYDKSGKLYRRVEAEKVEVVQGYPTVVKAVASDLKSGSRTVNEFSSIKYDIGLSERIFTERFLRRPPREVGK